jgi:hypothetical protein
VAHSEGDKATLNGSYIESPELINGDSGKLELGFCATSLTLP